MCLPPVIYEQLNSKSTKYSLWLNFPDPISKFEGWMSPWIYPFEWRSCNLSNIWRPVMRVVLSVNLPPTFFLSSYRLYPKSFRTMYEFDFYWMMFLSSGNPFKNISLSTTLYINSSLEKYFYYVGPYCLITYCWSFSAFILSTRSWTRYMVLVFPCLMISLIW